MKKTLKKKNKFSSNAVRYFSNENHGFQSGTTYVSISTSTIDTVNVCETWCPSQT